MSSYLQRIYNSCCLLSEQVTTEVPALVSSLSSLVTAPCAVVMGDSVLLDMSLSNLMAGQNSPRRVAADVKYCLDNYPTKTTALMWSPGEILLATAGGSGWMTAAGLLGMGGEAVMIAYGDQKKSGEEGHTDHQDADIPVWKRGFMPKQYPSETAVNFIYLQNVAIAASSYSTMEPYQMVMTGGLACGLALWQVPQAAPDAPKLADNWNQLARPAAKVVDWVRERPARAAAWVFILALNVPQVFGGLQSAPTDWNMTGSGLCFATSNLLMMRISKRQETMKAVSPIP